MKKILAVVLMVMVGFGAISAETMSDEEYLDMKIEQARKDMQRYKQEKTDLEKQKAEAEVRRKAEAKAQQKAEEEARQKATEESQRKAEEEKPVELTVNNNGKKRIVTTTTTTVSTKVVVNVNTDKPAVKTLPAVESTPAISQPPKPQIIYIEKAKKSFQKARGKGYGGWGGATTFFSQINGQDAMFTGGEGAFVFKKNFYIGGAGYALLTPIETGECVDGRKTFYEMAYGGLLMGLTLFPNRAISFNIHALAGVGMGGTGYLSEDIDIQNIEDFDDWDDIEFNIVSKNKFFVLEPGVDVEVRIAKFFRVGATASYRYIFENKDFMNNNQDLSGYSVGLYMRFGSF